MPSTSDKQRKFMGAELGRKRAGKKTQTGMSEGQLREFAGSVRQHGSIDDVDALNYTGSTKLKLSGFLYTPGEECHDAQRHHELLSSWEAREIKDLPDYDVEVVCHGPDTNWRAEEIDPHQYGRSYEPYPLKDYFKTDDKMEERTFRLREQDEYDEFETPGAITSGDSGQTNRRSFSEQRDYARGVVKAPEYDAQTSGIDKKKGSKLR